jgi:hypoxanthine phosphoribosyltransferase
LKIPLLAIQAQNHKYNEPERGEKGNTIVLGEIYGFGNVGKNVLLVDDICDSGDTISRVTNYLKEKKIVVDAAVMVMRFNYSSVKYWSLIIENNDWVVFPYEPSPEEVL